MDEGSGLSDDSSAFSDECGDARHTILKKKSTTTQKQYIHNAGDIIVKKEEMCQNMSKVLSEQAFYPLLNK
eukprot:5743391-Ditylum_brightwellii.AAC.1